jgi:hypothetical protein
MSDLKVIKVIRALKEMLDLKVMLVLKAIKVIKDHRV